MATRMKQSVVEQIKRDRVLKKRIRRVTGSSPQGLDYALGNNTVRLIGIDILREVSQYNGVDLNNLIEDDGN